MRNVQDLEQIGDDMALFLDDAERGKTIVFNYGVRMLCWRGAMAKRSGPISEVCPNVIHIT